MRYIRQNGQPSFDFFVNSEFAEFKAKLDSEMKRLQGKGAGSKTRQAEILSEDEEELQWNGGFLGDRTPQSLLGTMVFCNGLYFALQSGTEHRQLRLHPCQIEVIEKPGETPYLKYTEDISKNRPSGLKGRKVKQKVVLHYANTQQQERCFVRIFKKYMELLPDSRPHDAFYFQPLKNPTPTTWFTNKPVGHHTLRNTLSRLCKNAGITGYKSNYSLRATAATRLYQSGVDQQLVME